MSLLNYGPNASQTVWEHNAAYLGSMCRSQIEKFKRVQSDHPEAVIIRTGDEKTGRRFGNAAKRACMAVKIGSGGRNKGQRGYQLWASWAECDLKGFAK